MTTRLKYGLNDQSHPKSQLTFMLTVGEVLGLRMVKL